MVEEATGASRYELKKKNSQSMIEKKQTALNTIDNLLNETILPNLEKLKKEQSGLKEYNRVSQEVAHLNKVYTAYHYIRNQELCEESGARVTEKKKAIEEANKSIEEGEDKANEITAELVRLEMEKDKEFGGQLIKLEQELKDYQMNETKLISTLNNKKDGLKEAEKKKTAIEKQRAADAKLMKQREGEYSKIRTTFDQIEESNKQNESTLEKAQRDFEAISAGASRAADGEAAGTLKDQLMQAKKEIADMGTEITTSNMKLNHANKELNRKQAEFKKIRGSLDQDAQKVGQVRAEVERLKSQLESQNFNEEDYRNLVEERKLLFREVGGLNDHIQNKESRNSRTQFQHWAPNFDNRKIVGMVCNLFRIKDPRTAVALEEVVGGKLYNIAVVDTEASKTLLNHGQLKKKFTFLPLDRIEGQGLDRNALRNAERLVGKDNVQAAIDLIEYEPHLEQVMRYAFGDTLVCPDMDTAKKVAFDRGVMKRVVTFDGDLFDPKGTLRGGSRDKAPSFLIELAELSQHKEELLVKRRTLEELDGKLRSLEQINRSYGEAKRALEIKMHELELIEKNLENTNKFQLQQEIKHLDEQVQELEAALEDLPDRKKAAEISAKEIEGKIKNSKGLRERELKEAEEFLKKARTAYDKSRKITSERTHEVDTIRLEIEELTKTIEAYNDQIKELEEEINGHKDDVDEATANVQDAKQQVSSKLAEVHEQKQLLKNKSDEIGKLGRKRDQLAKLAEAKRLDIKKLQHELEQIKNDSVDAAHKVKSLLKKNAWIGEEKHLFGNEAAGYPFKKTDFDVSQVKEDIATKEARLTALKKTVNMRAGTMLTDRENEAKQVTERRKIVDTDKQKLINYMQEVDCKKKEELEKAFVVINTNFASIFKSMLPGTDAKLAPPVGKTIHDGLEVKVAFGDIWKETLTELSGGQRSLVALSLILALLRYNPAPIYILDEVDAALDQSHTTNIGKMIKENFPNSQVS